MCTRLLGLSFDAMMEECKEIPVLAASLITATSFFPVILDQELEQDKGPLD